MTHKTTQFGLKGKRRLQAGLACAVSVAALMMAAPGSAAVLAAEGEQSISIEAGALDAALLQLSNKADIFVLVDPALVQGKLAPAVDGRLTAEAALTKLLAGTGLGFTRRDDGAYVVTEQGRQAASAQSADTGDSAFVLEEILVTATKKGRAENMQTVPIAITAMNEHQLDKALFESIADIGHTIPNAVLEESQFVPGQAAFFIRGVGVNHTAQTMDPSVGVVINGMSLGQNMGMTTDNFDLESLEILRGPQGTLFGRNATGGAVVLRTKRPSGEFGAELRGTVGSYGRKDIAFAVEDSLIDGVLAGRIAMMAKEHDGYFTNAQGGPKIGEGRTKVIRPTLHYTPTESFEAYLFSEYGRADSGMPPLRQIFDPDTYYSTIYTPTTDDLQVLDHDFKGPNTIEWWYVIGEMNWDIGSGQLTSVTAYREHDSVVSIDIDGGGVDAPVHFIPSRSKQHQFSQELRYAFPVGERINLTTGLYYFNQSYHNGLGTDVFGGITLKDGYTDHETAAIFAQGEVSFTDELVLTLGGRYTKETKDGRYSVENSCALPPVTDLTLRTGCFFGFEGSRTWKNFSPRVGLQWLVNDVTQVYGSWTQGFKSGGFNNEADSVAAVGPFDEETVEAYEVGLKTDLFDRRVRFNLAAFFNKYNDMQRSISFGTPGEGFDNRLLNAGRAEVMGLEAELNWIVTDHLSITANLGLMSNDIKEFPGLDVDGDGAPDPELAVTRKLARVPDVTYGMGVTYDVPLPTGEMSLHGNYNYTGERFSDDANAAYLAPYKSLNVKATYRPAEDSRFSVSAFGKNITNEDAPLWSLKTSFYHIAQIRTPATWGVEISYQY